MTIAVREERPEDVPAVRAVNEAAFGQPAEAEIVDALRAGCPQAVSLVAADAGDVVGHVLFSPVTVDGAAVRGMGLAPMAVAPARQREGIGSLLVRAGVESMRARGCPFLVVLGHPAFYSRFGFSPAVRHGLACQWEVPPEAFMALALDETAMDGVTGTVRYRAEFDA